MKINFKLFVILFFSVMLLLSCDETPIVISSHAEFNPDFSCVENLKTESWQKFQRLTFQSKTSHNQLVKFHLYTPNNMSASTPLIIGIHGATSNKLDTWGTLDSWSYSKGGELTKMALENGYSFIAVDLSHHGEHYLNSENWDYTNNEEYDSVFINHWAYFHEETMLSFESVLNFSKNSGLFDTTRTGFVCYSLGGYFINQTAKLHGSAKSLIYLAASTGYVEGPEYGPVQNQSGLENCNAIVVASESDQLIPLSESEWMYNNLNMKNKTFVKYAGDPQYPEGHSLPNEYVAPLIEWLKVNL